MIYLNNNKIYRLGGSNRAYLNGKLCYQAYVVPTSKTYVYVETNNQWELSTVDGGQGYTTFQSFSNKGLSVTQGALLRIRFFGVENFSFKYRSEGWSTYVYLCVGDVDVDLSSKVDTIRYNTTGVKYNTRGNATPKEWKNAEYSNLDPTVEHFIDVIYIKTYGASFNEDRGFISLVTSETIEKWEASTTEYVTVNNGNGTYTFYTLEYKYMSVDDGKTWIPTTASRQGETELTQSLVAVEGHICNNGNKYSKNEIYVELGGNLIGTEIYSRGDLIEEGAEDCQVQEIEWIANTQTVVSSSTKPSDLQDVWFDFNVPITKNIKFQIDFTLMYMSGGMLIGNKDYNGTNEEWRFFSYWANKAFLFDNWSGGSTDARLWARNFAEVNTRYNLEVGNFYIKNLTTNVTLSSYNAYNRTYDGKYISLWCGTKKTEPSDGAKIHSLKIYESDTLVRDLVPALNSDNQAGLYDKINGTFYLPQGTGTLYHS